MKKILFILMAMYMGIATLSAEEKVIDHSKLPKNIREFVVKYFPQEKISISTEERDFFDKDYKVILTNGVKLEFDNDGNWTEITCKKNSNVPLKIVPANISQYIKEYFPNNQIIIIERSRRFIEVELDNDIELKFNQKGELLEIDN